MDEKQNKIEIGPQPGPQTEFNKTSADIAIYGGAAGGGKSYSLLLEPLRHINNSKFGGVIFRRTIPQIKTEGGIWDEASDLYPLLGAKPNLSDLIYTFPSKMKIKFAHLEYEKNLLDYQSAQIPYIGFDELCQFTKRQFFYMLSRNRSTSGVPGYVRAACNPDPDSWVREFIDWWIGDDGFPIPERSGKIRWFRRINDEFVWHDYKFDDLAKSVTFIPAKLEDNKILTEKDPSYRANLEAQSYVDRMQLLGGNWNIRATAGTMFKKEWFEIVDAIPSRHSKTVRYWDRAASESDTADWTAGVRMHRADNGLFYISHVHRFRGRPLKVEEAVKNFASQDGYNTEIGIEQDPGQAGVSEAESYTRLLAGFIVKLYKATTNKVTRAKAFSAQCEAGNVKILRGAWNEAFLNELEAFPDGKHDDQVDAASGAFNTITGSPIGEVTKEMTESKIKTIVSTMGGNDW